ncbi:MAG: distal tail protein Dit [Bacillota bacterium]
MTKSRLNFIIEYPDGQIVDMHEKGIWVSSFHIYSPKVERTIFEHPQKNGGRLISTKIGIRKVSISFSVEKESLQEFDEAKHEIYQSFYCKEEYKIIRDLYPDRYLMALHEGEYDIDNLTESDGEFSIELLMLDPYIYENEKELVITSSPINLGTVEYSPVITANFNSASSSFKITHQESGKFVEVLFGFVSGDVLTIDLNKRKVIINGNINMAAYTLKSRAFQIEPGDNHLVIQPSGVADVKLAYKPKSL